MTASTVAIAARTVASQAAPAGIRPRVLSGMQPTADLHIGNYLGALVNWVEVQHTHECFFPIVDLHAITVPQDPAELRESTRVLAALYLASGIDPRVSTVFVQSQVPAHSELAWILNCVTPIGWLERMTQFKEKAGAHRERASAGLFDYPVLMAADILLYGDLPPRPILVPVGEDQKQHLELARDIADRFNRRFRPVFSPPEPYIGEAGARIMGLDDPTEKMSKSIRRRYHSVRLLDTPDDVGRKVMRAVTDAGRDVRFEPERPGLYNLLTIYELLSGQSPAQIEAHFQGKGYADLKRELAELVVEKLRPLQERYQEIRREPGYLEDVLRQGAVRARTVTAPVLQAAKEAAGLG